MNATYAITRETAAAAELETFKAHARETAGAVKTTMMLAAAPLLGLAFESHSRSPAWPPSPGC